MPDHTVPWPRRPGSPPAACVAPHRTPGGKLRWLTTLSPDAGAAYGEAVSGVLSAVERHLGREVMADRGGARPGAGSLAVRLAPWQRARGRWRAAAERGLSGATRALLITDVRDCYASVSYGAVRRALLEAGAPAEAVDRVAACLLGFADEGVAGLPVGPPASAVLANATLAALDQALRGRGTAHLRWVDDVTAFTPSRAEAIRALAVLHRASATIGLELHPTKTRIVDDPAEARSILRVSNSPGAAPGVA